MIYLSISAQAMATRLLITNLSIGILKIAKMFVKEYAIVDDWIAILECKLLPTLLKKCDVTSHISVQRQITQMKERQ